MKLEFQGGIEGNRTLLCSKFVFYLPLSQSIDVSLDVGLPLRFTLELEHPFAGRQSWVYKTVIAETWHRKNAVEDQGIEKDGEILQIIDIILAVELPRLCIEEPIAAKETKFRKATILFLCLLEAFVYVTPVVSFRAPFLKARLLLPEVVSRCVVVRLATASVRFQTWTKVYLSLFLAQFHHILDDIKAGGASQVSNFEHVLGKASSRRHHETAAIEYFAMITLRVSRLVRLFLLPLSQFSLHQSGLLLAQLGFFLPLLFGIHIRFEL
ncbi:hypothetical protein EJ08DRAFT_201284 [Tothia fuscella]|uniref:Uncharacterized protein n=1 Tax=Tothia fuscella TaxID=1048955 RepID=A0A9P4TY82_9PEZI|nr:hypothetical protein EJ08DRAFT_201284 [Tothia fuscella]